MQFFVVIPIYNEERRLRATLDALANQTDRDFTLILVDNGSIDGTRQVIRAFCNDTPDLRAIVIDEPQKGTGAAADTGFRHAITLGATHIARTDADCLPAPDWIAILKRAFIDDQLHFIGGAIRPRSDEATLTLLDRLLIRFLLVMADFTGWLRRRGSENQYTYFMVAGNNLAITADMYERAGGFPRTATENAFEDRILSEAVRKLTPHAARVPQAIVYNSLRRLRAYGYLGTVLWYWNRLYRPSQIDIR